MNVKELKEILNDYPDDLPIHVLGFINPDDIIKNIDKIKEVDYSLCLFDEDFDYEESGCFDSEHCLDFKIRMTLEEL